MPIHLYRIGETLIKLITPATQKQNTWKQVTLNLRTLTHCHKRANNHRIPWFHLFTKLLHILIWQLVPQHLAVEMYIVIRTLRNAVHVALPASLLSPEILWKSAEYAELDDRCFYPIFKSYCRSKGVKVASQSKWQVQSCHTTPSKQTDRRELP